MLNAKDKGKQSYELANDDSDEQKRNRRDEGEQNVRQKRVAMHRHIIILEQKKNEIRLRITFSSRRREWWSEKSKEDANRLIHRASPAQITRLCPVTASSYSKKSGQAEKP